MYRTLVLIPHEIAGLPVFGFGWVLILLVIGAAGFFLYRIRNRQPDDSGQLPTVASVIMADATIWGILAVVVAIVLPWAELKNLDGEPVGMAIRGYGMFLLLAVSAAVGLAMYRAPDRGMHSDVILGLAPWLFVGGILGARLFYVIQYRERFANAGWVSLFDFTSGGLVVYGSIIGGFLTVVWFTWRHRISLPRLGDVIIPCLFIGIALGRLGCLMNGCCFGGRCDDAAYALHFPDGSPAYVKQLERGHLLGLEVDPDGRVRQVADGSPAARRNIAVGDQLKEITAQPIRPENADLSIPAENATQLTALASIGGRTVSWDANELPRRALAVYPAQVISAICSLSLCGLLLFLSRFYRRDGTLLAIGTAGYTIVRFGLELVRDDELGQLGTALTISQWVSLILFPISVGFLVIFARRMPVAPRLGDIE
ncbi:MAG: prolipoprotein diacylglyceryl transferase family protein [Planctomycetota bacterium]